MAEAPRDKNRIPTLLGTSSTDGVTPVTVYADPTTHRLKVDASASTSLTINTSTITGGTTGQLLYDNAGKVGELAVATYPSLTELSYVKGVTSAIQTQLNAKAASLSPLTTLYVDAGIGNDSTGNGTISKPYATISKAVTIGNATSASYALDISPGSYTDASVPTVSQVCAIRGNGATYTINSGAGTLTLSNFFNIFNLTVIGNIVQSSVDTTAFCYFTNVIIRGNLTSGGSMLFFDGLITGNGAANSVITINNTSITYFQNCNLGGPVANYYAKVINNGQLYFLSCLLYGNDNSNYALTSTGSSKLTVVSSVVINVGTAGGINCTNGATGANPNEITISEVFVNGTTNAITCGSSVTFIDVVKCFNSNTGLPVLPTGSAFSNAYSGAIGLLGSTSGATIIQTSATASGTLTLPAATDTLVGKATTDTLTNKRITPRVLSAASYTTDTGTSLNCDNLDQFIVTAQAGALKLNNPTGTPTDGQKLIVAITGTAARALTYDTQFEASTVALPTTTVTTARLNIGFIWRADTSKWVCIASA